MAVYNANKRIDADCWYPIGAVLVWTTSTPPDGFLLCDGSEYSSTAENGKYKELFDIIGTTYGVGSDSDSFRVPDCRKRFVEGASESLSVGQKLDAKIPAHNHTFTGSSTTSTNAGSHTHGGGSMNFNGSFAMWWGPVNGTKVPLFTYADDGITNNPFTKYGNSSEASVTTNFPYQGGWACTDVTFNAANGWSGNSSEVGNHTHSFTAKGNLDNASKHNNVYGKSTTVQPASICLNYIIRYK